MNSRVVQSLVRAMVLAVVAVCGGCGAGLISGVAASGGGGDGAPPPEVSVQAGALLPLVPPADFRGTVLILNAALGGAPGLQVVLEAEVGAGPVRQTQGAPQVSPEGPNSRVSFAIVTTAIQAAIGDPTAQSLPARLWVEVDGRIVGAAVPVSLGAQPVCAGALQLDADGEVVVGGDGEPVITAGLAPLSALGGVAALRFAGLRSGSAISAFVAVQSPFGVEERAVAAVTSAEWGADGVATLRLSMPGSAFPRAAELVVVDSQVGEAVPVGFYYRPEVDANFVSQGATDGGQVVTVVGAALAPFSSNGDGALDFDRVQLSFRKRRAVGGVPFSNPAPRVVDLPRADFRVDESSNDRLVFNVPPSPDGRPGDVDITVRVFLGDGPVTFDADEAAARGGVVLSTTANNLFLYSNPDPIFGPRGAIFETLPITVAAIAIDNASAAPAAGGVQLAPDMVALSEQGGVAYLQLLLAQQNGMFQPFSKPQRVGDPLQPRQRDPRDLLVGDFNRDNVPDVFVVSAGADPADPQAEHLVVLGQARPAPPLGAVHRYPLPSRSARGRVVDFDGDGYPDVLLVPAPDASGRRPHVLLSAPPIGDAPAFSAPITVPIDVPCEAFEVADLDGDGHLDVAVFSGTTMQLAVSYGTPSGAFPAASTSVATVELTHGPFFQDYVPRPESPAVGLHACRDGALQSLAIALVGTEDQPSTPPLVSVLRQVLPRVFVGLDGGTTVSPEPIGLTLLADLDAEEDPDGSVELVVAGRGDPVLVSLALLQFQPAGPGPNVAHFDALATAIDGAESAKQIRTMIFDRAVPDVVSGSGDDAQAVFLVHESDVDGSREKRLSTRLVRASPDPSELQLLPADAGGRLTFELRQLALGTFHAPSPDGVGAVPDVAVLDASSPADASLNLILNDGFGGFPVLGGRLALPGLVEGTLAVVGGAGRQGTDAIAVLDAAATLHFWAPVLGADPDLPQVATASVALAPSELAGATLGPGSRLLAAKVVGDSFVDLVVMLSFEGVGEDGTRLAVLRGRSSEGGTQLPFVVDGVEWAALPTATTDVVVGDFCLANDSIELAVAVQQGAGVGGGEHVRFLRYDAALARVVPSSTPGLSSLHAGDEPTRLAAVDFDGDGDTDLLVAGGTPALRLFRNVGCAPGAVEVDVAGFLESATSPIVLPGGRPTDLFVADVDGDGATDAVVFLEETALVGGVPTLRSRVATAFNVGGTDLSEPAFTSITRLGDFDAPLAGAVGDWNLDAVPDLFVGWGKLDIINLRVLFGGTR